MRGLPSNGVSDPNVAYSIAGGTTGRAVTVTPQASYGSPVAGSRWINTSGSTGCDQACGSPGSALATAYTMEFTLPVGYASPSISIEVLADDAATVLVNGNQFGQQPQNKGNKNYQNIGSYSTSTAGFFKSGTNTLTVSNIDYGGSNGVDFSATVTFMADTTPPAASPTPAPAANVAGWNNTDVVVSWNWVDGSAGIDPSKCTTSSTTSGEFSSGQTLSASCTDLAGNTGTKTYTVQKVDKTKPTISGAASPTPNAAGWNNTDVTVTFTCSDALSGLAAGSPPAAVTLQGEGANQSRIGSCSDVAGNSSSTTVGPINIDTTAPNTTATAPSGWNNTSVTVSLNAADALSGIAVTYYTLDGSAQQSGTSVAISTEGTHTLQFWSVDNAGNTETAKTVLVKIDKTPPTINHTQSPAPNANGWNNADVTVTFTCADIGGSGVATCTAPQTVTTEGQNQPVPGTAADNAGNSATDPATVSIDKTAPTISAAADRAANGSGWYNADVVIGFTCDDALSGVKSCPDAPDPRRGREPVGERHGDRRRGQHQGRQRRPHQRRQDRTDDRRRGDDAAEQPGLLHRPGHRALHLRRQPLGRRRLPGGPGPRHRRGDGTVSSNPATVTDKAGNSSAVSNIVTVTIDKTPSATPLLVKAASGSKGGIAGLVQTDGSTSRYDVTLYLRHPAPATSPGRRRSSARRPSRSTPPAPGPSPSTSAACRPAATSRRRERRPPPRVRLRDLRPGRGVERLLADRPRHHDQRREFNVRGPGLHG